MNRSGQQLGEQTSGGGGGFRGDSGGRGAAHFREDPARIWNIGGFGEDFTVGAREVRREFGGQGRGQVGGVGFEQEAAGGDARGVFAGAGVFRAGQGAAEGNVHVFGREIGKGIGGTGVGVDEQAGRMRGQGGKDFQHGVPGIAAVQAGGPGEFIGKVELGAEDGFAVGIELVAHAGVEADFADAGGAGGQDFAEVLQPAGAAIFDEPGVDAEGAEDQAGVRAGQGGDSGPVGFAGGVGMEAGEAGGAGAGEDLGQVDGEARILQVGVGVEPNQFFTVGRHGGWYASSNMVKGRTIPVNLQKWRGAGLALLLAVAATGCGTFSHYPDGMEATTLGPLRTGQKPDYQKTFGKRMKGTDGVLFAMEMGRVAQLEGDTETSQHAFERAIKLTADQDDKATISASGAAAQGGAVLVNDKVIPYRAPSYERTLVYHYQALNYLAMNDVIGAGVEVRRANREQEAAQDRHDKEISQAKSQNQNAAAATNTTADGEARDPQLTPVYAGLDQVAGAVKYSFQNAATFYVSAVIWEMLGEPNDAYIDYKKALEIYPENPYLQQDVVRLGKRLGMREDLDDFARRFPDAMKTAAAGTGEFAGKARLVVVYEEGSVPQKSEMALAYPVADTIGAISLPMYAAAPPAPVPVAVTAGGKALGCTAPICNVAALAARALGEQMPGILTRQVARAVTKAVAAKAASDQGGELAGLIATIYNVVSEQADLRSWLSLPAHIQVLSAWTEPGQAEAAVAAPGGGRIWAGPVTLKAGKTTVIHVTKLDLAVFSQVMVQP